MANNCYAVINGKIFTGETTLENHALLVAQDRIAGIVPQTELPNGIQTYDIQGAYLCAGFIDLQLNGCGGVMFNQYPTVQTLEIMQKTNLRSGTTSFLPTFITANDAEMQQAIFAMEDYLKQHRNQALGLHLEGPYISVAKKGVHRADLVRTINPEMLNFLHQHASCIRKLTLAAENDTAQYIPQFVNDGIIVSIGHSNADFDTAQQAFTQGASFATHLHNGMSAISSGRDLGVVGAVLANDNVYAGIIIDGLHVHYANVRLDKSLKGDKLCIVTDATAAAGADIDHFDFVGKRVEVKNGRCYDSAGSLGGSAITMIQSIQNAVVHVGIPLEETIRMATLYPARAIKVDHYLGQLKADHIANLTAFTADFNVIATAVNGNWHWNEEQ